MRELVSKFRVAAGGSATILFSVMMIVLMLIVGIAVDSSRFYNLSTRTQASLDEATLAGARMLADDNVSDLDIESITKAHFDAALKKSGVKIYYQAPLQVVIDRINSSVTTNAHLFVKSFFGRLAGQAPIAQINRTSNVVFDLQKIELSMVLDITGSMAGQKLTDLKAAAKDVVDILMKQSINENAVRIAVAPYSASVNAGSLSSAVANLPTTTTCGGGWFLGFMCQTSTGAAIDPCVIERQGINAFTDAAPTGSDKLSVVTTLPYGNYFCPVANILPLTGKSGEAQIKTMIDGMQASGGTAGHIGTAWGWYLLSPNWSSVLPAQSDPKPYGDAGNKKAMIIMTDGVFNTSYFTNPPGDSVVQSNDSYNSFDQLCDGIKAKKIEVFTVGFELNDARALSELQNCASGTDHFFDTKSGADLKKAFKDIANKLTQLRVAS